ncbi:universal stress protein [Chondromyces crocatus]|uniref:Universal stress protein n=1 Tax=Chondromyces crocatus TaxID=52 RepID=A0A0K1ECK5_CHOCO|nr:universal stress protein [Chondromyces crocatus]AKT38596.1 universal stress protein [Chondromyces crocatus]
MFRSLLIPVDLTPSAERVLGRAAMLPLADGARVTLVHVIPRWLPTDASKRAEGDARKALAATAKRFAKQLPKGTVVEPVVKVGSPAAEIAAHAREVEADLIVVGRGSGRSIRDAFLGSTAERIVREGQRPVLVVRLSPRASYRKPALALELDQAACDVITLLLQTLPSPCPPVAVVHAYNAPYQNLIYPSLSEEEGAGYRNQCRQQAIQGVAKLLAAAVDQVDDPEATEVPWKTYIRHGSPRDVIPKVVETANIDLLVLGTRGYAGIAHAFLGTVAGEVLREVGCDVLVVPPRQDTSASA